MSIPQAGTALVALRAPHPQAAGRRVPSTGPVRVWLWAVAACVFAMVVVGGATRLTQSGLSITEWKPVMGVLPPLDAVAWQAEFDKYKTIPQFARLNPDMTLAGFKSIFYWEWAHRLLGRLVGALVAVPLVLFWLAGRLPPGLKPRLVGLLVLGGLQGVIGWFMVKSGLSARTEVSQYFLALHLVTASITFAWTIALAEGLRRAPLARGVPALDRLRRTASVIVGLVLAQIGLGAFVAGLHAGLAYNTWPLMDGHLVPPLADLARQSPPWSNLFENVTTVQFDHRTLAYAVLIAALFHAADAWSKAPGTAAARRAGLLVLAVATQAAVGIATLLLVVPLWAALLHQGFAMAVLGLAVLHRRRLSAPAVRVVQAAASPLGAKA